MHLLYCCTIWGNTRNELLNNLLILQKRAAILILYQDPRSPIGLFRQLEWIPVHNIKMRKNSLEFPRTRCRHAFIITNLT